jgi:hypothetical protein
LMLTSCNAASTKLRLLQLSALRLTTIHPPHYPHSRQNAASITSVDAPARRADTRLSTVLRITLSLRIQTTPSTHLARPRRQLCRRRPAQCRRLRERNEPGDIRVLHQTRRRCRLRSHGDILRQCDRADRASLQRHNGTRGSEQSTRPQCSRLLPRRTVPPWSCRTLRRPRADQEPRHLW